MFKGTRGLLEEHWHSVLLKLVQSEFQPQILPEGCTELVTITIVYVYSDLRQWFYTDHMTFLKHHMPDLMHNRWSPHARGKITSSAASF